MIDELAFSPLLIARATLWRLSALMWTMPDQRMASQLYSSPLRKAAYRPSDPYCWLMLILVSLLMMGGVWVVVTSAKQSSHSPSVSLLDLREASLALSRYKV